MKYILTAIFVFSSIFAVSPALAQTEVFNQEEIRRRAQMLLQNKNYIPERERVAKQGNPSHLRQYKHTESMIRQLAVLSNNLERISRRVEIASQRMELQGADVSAVNAFNNNAKEKIMQANEDIAILQAVIERVIIAANEQEIQQESSQEVVSEIRENISFVRSTLVEIRVDLAQSIQALKNL
jgi:hypothetical protein